MAERGVIYGWANLADDDTDNARYPFILPGIKESQEWVNDGKKFSSFFNLSANNNNTPVLSHTDRDKNNLATPFPAFFSNSTRIKSYILAAIIHRNEFHQSRMKNSRVEKYPRWHIVYIPENEQRTEYWWTSARRRKSVTNSLEK